MPAEKWQVDGEYHSIVPQFVTGISPWIPRPEQWKDPARLYTADPATGPSHITDVDVRRQRCRRVLLRLPGNRRQ